MDRRPKSWIFLVFLIGIVLQLQAADADWPSLGTRKNGASSVFSLFNLKGKSRFWSEDIIRGDFDDLESSVPSGSEKMSLLNYTRAGSLASYLKLSEVESMYLPIPLNFIFIGFEGKGNQGFKLGPEELQRWFTKIDHIFEHTRVPTIGEVLVPFYQISVDKAQRHHLPLISHINHNFSVHAVQMGERVTSVFEHAIKVLSRKDDVSNDSNSENILWQVDMDRMEYLFRSLIEYLELDGAYNIFILNPKRDKERSYYGYRRGLSESEISFLKKHSQVLGEELPHIWIGMGNFLLLFVVEWNGDGSFSSLFVGVGNQYPLLLPRPTPHLKPGPFAGLALVLGFLLTCNLSVVTLSSLNKSSPSMRPSFRVSTLSAQASNTIPRDQDLLRTRALCTDMQAGSTTKLQV